MTQFTLTGQVAYLRRYEDAKKRFERLNFVASALYVLSSVSLLYTAWVILIVVGGLTQLTIARIALNVITKINNGPLNKAARLVKWHWISFGAGLMAAILTGLALKIVR